MAEDLFIPYHSHLPQHVQDNFDENEVLKLNGDGSFEDLIAKGGWTFEQFYSFVKERVIFITPDTAISVSCDTPSHHKYTIDTTFVVPSPTNIINKRTLHVSGVDAQSTSPALNGLLRFVLASHCDENIKNNDKDENINNDEPVKVILKCFPMTPRQQLGSLDLSSLGSNVNRKREASSSSSAAATTTTTAATTDIATTATTSSCNSNIISISISFQFLALEKSHCQAIFNGSSNVVSCVEFRQCEIDGWMVCEEREREDQNCHDKGTIIINNGSNVGLRPQKLTVSCTQREFRKFAEGRLLMTKNKNESITAATTMSTTATTTSIRELYLVLHFMLAEADVQYLTTSLQNNQSLEYLSIEYLELDDNTWRDICKSLHNHPNLKGISLAYTEKFADSYRRLNPERRRSRTNDILRLLYTNKILQEINWPKFQQDESLIPDVERLLMENRRAAAAATSSDTN